MHTSESAATYIQEFSALRSWEDRYRRLMLLGKKLPVLDEPLKTDDALLAGCESQVWFYHSYDGDKDLINWQIDSDARIIRGLITLLLAACEELTPAQLLAFDGEAYFEQLQLLQHLSPSRGNGVRAILAEIKRCAALHCPAS